MSAPQTIEARTLTALALATESAGCTVPLCGVHRTYESRFGTVRHKAVSHALACLIDRGLVTKHGRIRHLCYATTQAPVPHRDGGDPLPEVLAIVKALTRAKRRAVATSEVHQQLAARGLRLSPDQVRTRLETLGRSSQQKRNRGVGQWGEAQLERVESRAALGRQQVHWRPVGSSHGVTVERTKADLAREAIRVASAALGRPARRTEVLRWARTVCEEDRNHAAAASVLERRATPTFNAACYQDSRRGGPTVTVRTALTSRGSYPARFAWGRVGDIDLALCCALDAATLIDPRREHGVADQLGKSLLSPSFAKHVLEARTAAATQAATALLPDAGLDWAKLLEIDRAAADTLADWTERGPETKFKKDAYIESLGRASDQLGALADLVSTPPPSGRTVRHIADYRGTRLEDLEEVGAEVRDLAGLEFDHWRALFSDVRRLRGAVAGGISTDDLDDTRSWLDRPDALVHAVRQVHLPQIDAFVSSAELVLGASLRDADLLLEWLSDGTACSPTDKEAVIVALGLLGRPAPLDLVWPDRRDGHRAAAVIACLALGVDDPKDRVARIEAVERAANGPARAIAEQALLRAQMGSCLSVLD